MKKRNSTPNAQRSTLNAQWGDIAKMAMLRRMLRPMVAVFLVSLVMVFCLAGCAQPPKIQQNSPAAVVGQDLNQVAATAIADWAKVSSGNTDYAWALQEAFNAYKDVIKTANDVKALVKVWTAGKGMKLADRLALLFQTANGSASAKTEALAVAAGTAASTETLKH